MKTEKREDQYRVHETDEDRARQFDILLAYTAARRLIAITKPKFWRWDADIYRYPNFLGRAEIKYRFHKFGKYPTYTIDRSKLDVMIWKGHCAILIISWLGDIRHAEIFHPIKIVGWQERGDRDEDEDFVAHIALSEFRKL